MNKKLFIIIFLLFSLTGTFTAQDKFIQTADRYFNQFNYSKAVKKYLKLIEEGKNTYYATNKIAECYKHLQKPEKAIEWYLKAIKFPDFDYKLYYSLAQELKKVNQYESSHDYMQKYMELSGALINDYNYPLKNYIRLLKEDSARYEIYNLKINSASSEFGPCVYSNKLIFSSNRPVRKLVNRDDIMTNQPFYNLYQAKIISLYDLGTPKHFAENIKSNLNIGPICFNREHTLMYITKNTTRTKKGNVTLDIFITKKTKGKWDKNSERIPMQNSGFTVAHPSLSKDGKRFYFSSDMPGGYGGMDLYVCDNKNGFLSTPENLGSEINTAGNEVFPFVSDDGRLYFASDGLQGLGGLDIFFAIPTEDSFSYPFNMGYPINTSADDFSLILSSNMRTGYLTSNRAGGKGEDDIYALRIIKPLNYCLIVGTVVDEISGEPINGTQVIIKNNKGLVVYKLTTDPNGGFSIYLKGDKNYSFSCRKKLYKELHQKFTEVQMLNKKILQVELSLHPK
jgi:Tol biopolymer transport system component